MTDDGVTGWQSDRLTDDRRQRTDGGRRRTDDRRERREGRRTTAWPFILLAARSVSGRPSAGGVRGRVGRDGSKQDTRWAYRSVWRCEASADFGLVPARRKISQKCISEPSWDSDTNCETTQQTPQFPWHNSNVLSVNPNCLPKRRPRACPAKVGQSLWSCCFFAYRVTGHFKTSHFGSVQNQPLRAAGF